MGMIDLVVIATIIVSVLFALYRGLLRELMGITSWILAGAAALYSYQPINGLLVGQVENVKMWTLIITGLLALVVLIVMTIINARITRKLRKSSLSGLDRTLGFAFGVARAVLLIVLVWLFARQIALAPKQIEKMQEKNFCVKYIQQSADWAEKLLPNDIQQDIKRPEPPELPQLPKPVVEYKDVDREALDEMIEDIVDIEEL
jgi:membrane protein required for colicin V production